MTTGVCVGVFVPVRGASLPRRVHPTGDTAIATTHATINPPTNIHAARRCMKVLSKCVTTSMPPTRIGGRRDAYTTSYVAERSGVVSTSSFTNFWKSSCMIFMLRPFTIFRKLGSAAITRMRRSHEW